MINKLAKYKEQALEDFSKPERVYSDTELRDFHNKIQKFWDAPREVNAVAFGKKVEGVAQKFRFEDMAVAYGAARKVEQGKKPDGSPVVYYLYEPIRNRQLDNIWKQYEDWQKKQDWIDNKNSEGYEKLAEQIAF